MHDEIEELNKQIDKENMRVKLRDLQEMMKSDDGKQTLLTSKYIDKQLLHG
jgi:hypothetical protein